MSNMLKLMVVDNSNLIHRNIVRYSDKKNIDVVERASNGEEAIKRFNNCTPDIVVLDISTPGLNGVKYVEYLMTINKNTNILLVSSSPDETTCIEGVRKGAIGYLRKPFIAEQIFEALNIALEDTKDSKISH